MRFSVIIPVYQVKEYLTQCIESVLRQDFSDYEIILVDDGSTDGSGDICSRYAETDHRIKAFHQKNSGLSAARNTGIRNAVGDYLIFLDSDDYWLNRSGLTYIDRQIRDNSPDAVFWKHCKVEESCNDFDDLPVDGLSSELCKVPDGVVPFIRSKQLIACAWDVAIARKLFESGALDFEEGVYSEDVEWLTRLLRRMKSCVFADIVLNAYRIRQGSITKCPNDKNFIDLNNHYRCITGYIAEADNKTASMLRTYLGEQASIYILGLALSPPQLGEKYGNSEYLSYIRYCVTPRAKLIRLMKGIFGVQGTLFLIKKIKRL